MSTRLVEDANENGRRDAGEATASRETVVAIIPWSNPTPAGEVILITAADGHFVFRNVPPGDYSLRLYWPTGFIEPQAAGDVPHILRTAFRVNEDGSVGAPDPIPANWPNLPLERIDERTVLGALPAEIFVNKHNDTVLPTGSGTPAAVGEIDVAAYYAGREGRHAAAAGGWRGPRKRRLVRGGVVSHRGRGALAARRRIRVGVETAPGVAVSRAVA
jgi:hypothetical protein